MLFTCRFILCLAVVFSWIFTPVHASPKGYRQLDIQQVIRQTTGETIPASQKINLQAFTGPDIELPETIASALVTDIENASGITIAKTMLNGLPATLGLYLPVNSEIPNLVIAHDALSLVDYIPDLSDTEFSRHGNFHNAVFLFTPESNFGLQPRTQHKPVLAKRFGIKEFAEYKPQTPIALMAHLRLDELQDGPQLAEILQTDSRQDMLTLLRIDASLFSNVQYSDQSAQPMFPASTRTLAQLKETYGELITDGITLSAYASKLNGRSIGPATINNARWKLQASSTSQVLSLISDLRLPIANTVSPLMLNDVTITYDRQGKSLLLNGNIRQSNIQSLASQAGITLSTAIFDGEYKHEAESQDEHSLAFHGQARYTSRNNNDAYINYRIDLAINADGTEVDPTLTIESDLRLSDIMGSSIITSVADPALTKAVIRSDYQAGWTELHGAEVYSVRYKPENAAVPIIGLHHQSLDLGTYIPRIRGTNLGSFGLTNASFLILPETPETFITYEDIDEVPEPLKQIVDTNIDGMFPLELKPGVNVIGTYGTADDGGNARTVMKAYGMDEKGYVVKANFKISQLRNARFGKVDISNPIRGNERAICEAVTSADITGLDLSFPIPGFKPPYIGDALTLSNSRFSLKEIDGQIEPSIITGMHVNMDDNVTGMKAISMAGKFSVQGDLNQLCNRVTAESDIKVFYAGSTALNPQAIDDIAFSALQRVTTRNRQDDNTDSGEQNEDTEADDTAEPEEDAALAAAVTGSGKLALGWKPAFGLPFLEIRQFASSGTFEQKAGERSASWEVWTESRLGNEVLDMTGSMDLTLEDKQLDIQRWNFRLPGPVRIGGLPGLDKLPKANELVLVDIDLGNEELSGRVEWPAQKASGSAYIRISENDQQQAEYEVFARLDRFALSMLRNSTSSTDGVPDVSGIPNSIWEQNIGPVVMAWRNKEREILSLDDTTDEKLLPLFTGNPDSNIPNQKLSILNIGDQLLLAKGLTLAGTFRAGEINNDVIRNTITDLGLASDIALTGIVENDDNNQHQLRLTASTPSITPSASTDILGLKPSFGNSQLLISTLDNGEFAIESEASITLGQETINMFGLLSLKPDESGELKKDDWLFRAPGPVELGGLPGFEELPKINELSLHDIELSPDSLSGRINWDQQKTSGTAWLTRSDSGQFDFFARLDSFYPNMLLEAVPAPLGNKTISPALIAWRNQAREDMTLDEDTPERLAAMLGGVSDADEAFRRKPILAEGDTVTLAKGLTTIARTDIEELKKFQSFNLMLQRVRINDSGMLVTGAFEKADQYKGKVTATLSEFEVPDIPETTIKFINTQLELNNLQADKVALRTHADVTLPLPGKPTIPMDGYIDFELGEQNNTLFYELTVPEKLATRHSIKAPDIWTNPPMLPELQIANPGFDGRVDYHKDKTLHACALVGDAKIDSQDFRVAVEICQGRELSVVLSDPNSNPVLYIEDEIRLSRVLKALTSFAGKQSRDKDKAQPPDQLNKLRATVGDAAMRNVLVSRNAIAGEVELKIRDLVIKGRGALVKDDKQYAYFIRNNETIDIGDLLTSPLPPLDQVKIPKGVFIFSTQSTDEFDIKELPVAIFDDLFKGLLEKDKTDKLRVSDGLTFLTKSNTSELPPGIDNMVSTFGIKGDYILGGSITEVFSGKAPGITLYTSLKDVDAPLPDFAGEIIEIKDADAELFIKTDGPGQEIEVGFSTDATLKMPRLDTPTTRESIDTTISVAYLVGGTSGGGLEITAEVKGQWDDPLGLDDFSLTDTSVGIGVAGKGATVSIHSKEAVFKNKRLVMDLDSAWAGAIPTQLAVQFAKSPNHQGDLFLDPVTQVELHHRILKVALKGGSKLADSIRSRLQNINLLIDGVPGPAGRPTTTLVNSLEAFSRFSSTLANASDSGLSIMKKSPLGMIGIKNPQIFFVTPGDSLPPREGIDRPPLGLGLLVEGTMSLHAGDLSVDVAEGEYRVNLRDGYYASGTITPPAPFEESFFSMAGKQSLLNMTPTALRLEGNLAIPGNLIPGIPAIASGWFDFSREELGTGAQVSSGINIASGTINRTASIGINGRTLDIYSAPNGCVDYPVKLDGNLTVNSPADATKLLTLAKLDLPTPDPTTCPEALIAMWNTAVNTAKDYLDDPSKALNAPQDAQKAMLDATKTALNLLPDNPVTRELYKGIDAVEDALNKLPGAGDIPGVDKLPGTGDLVDLSNKIPGKQLLENAASEAAAKAAETASKAMQDALNVLGDNIGSQVAGKISGAVLDGLTDPVGFAGKGIGAISDGLSNLGKKKKNRCNQLIENMRDDNIAPETVERAKQLWQPLEAVWKASKEAEAIEPVVQQIHDRIRSTQDPFLSLTAEWNKIAAKVSPGRNLPLWNPHVYTYHTNHQQRSKDLPSLTSNTWTLDTGNMTYPLWKRAGMIHRLTGFKVSVEESLLQLKNWQETSNFDGNADYPGFRCQKQNSMVRSLLAIKALGITVPAGGTATDYMKYDEVHKAFSDTYQLAADMRAQNKAIIDKLKGQLGNAIERNMLFLAELKAKMETAIAIQRQKTEASETMASYLAGPVKEAEKAIKDLYDHAASLAANGSNQSGDNQLDRLLKTANTSISETYIAEINAQRNLLTSGSWASQDQQSMIIFPLARQCLRSFYQPADNTNPLYVSDCEPNVLQILDDIDNGVARNANDWKRYMEDSFYDAALCARDGYTESIEKLRECPHKRTVVDLRWQFWLWNAEQSGTVRMATAQSEQSPLATYCLGIPAAFAPSFGNVTVEATPCLENDTAQLWRKLPDESGEGNFRLQNVKYGICATWSGVTGVHAMILKPCIDSLKTNQVMTAGWPLRDAAKRPVVLSEDRQRTYVWKNFENRRCLRFHEANENGFTVTARRFSDWACQQAKSGGASEASFRLVPQQADNGDWRFTVNHNNQTSCIVSTVDKIADQFGIAAPQSGRNAFRTLALGNCDSNRSLWSIKGSNIRDEADQRKYQVQQASGEKLCMTVYEVLETNSSFYNLPILLRECKSKQPENENQLFFALEVDTNFNSKNNRDIAQWRQNEINDIRPITGSVRILNKDSTSATHPAVDYKVELLDNRNKNNRVAATRTDDEGNFRFALMRNDPQIPIEEEVDPALDVVVRDGKEYKVKVRRDIIDNRERGYITVGTRPRSDRYTLVVRLDERDTSLGWSPYDEGDDQPDGRIQINVAQHASSSDNNFILKEGMPIYGYSMQLSPDGMAPLANTRLELDDGDDNTENPVVTSNEAGRYRFSHVLPGRYTIIATHEGYIPYNEGYYGSGGRGKKASDRDGRITRNMGRNQSTNLNDFVFKRDVRSISGKVAYEITYGSGWSGLAGATLTLQDDDPETNDPQATSGKDGSYIFEDVEPGDYTIVETNPPHYQSVSDTDGDNDDRIQVTMGNSDLTGNDFMDRILVTVKGTVKHVSINKVNSPKANVVVELKGDTEFNADFSRTTRTNRNGEYRFKNVPFGLYKVTQILAPGEEPYTHYRYRESYPVNVGHQYRENDYEKNFQSVTPWWK